MHQPPQVDAATMEVFAATAEKVGATRSKLEKVGLLARYLASLEGAPLALAARWFGGRVFAPWDSRTLGIGGAAFSRLVRELTGADDAALSASWHRHADVGDVVFDLYSGPGTGRVALIRVDEAFAQIASMSQSVQRVELLLALLTECTSLAAKYVVKLMAGELRIGLAEGLVEAALVEAFSAEAKAVARAGMLVGDLGELALLAANDRLGEAHPHLFAPLRFMLASPVSDAHQVIKRLGSDVWVEDKYDGIRCQLHRSQSRVALYSRDLKEITRQFPEIMEAGLAVPDESVLDGEILAFKEGRVMPFSALQTRLGRTSPSVAAQEAVPVIYVGWDVLVLGGESQLDQPLRERRKLLEGMELGGNLAMAHLESAVDAEALDNLFDAARERLNEGLMVKDPDSPYLPGRRGLYWLKLKRPLDTLDVVVTGAEWGHGKRRAVLSDVTFAVRTADGDLVTVGKAYTGLTDMEIGEMTQLLQDVTLSTHGRFHAVRPSIVLEIAFDAVQPSARHKSGYALRFPRIVRWRRDKSPDDIDDLEKVAALAQARAEAFTQLVDQS